MNSPQWVGAQTAPVTLILIVIGTDLDLNGEYNLRFEAPFAGLTILLDLTLKWQLRVAGMNFKITAPIKLNRFHVLLNP